MIAVLLFGLMCAVIVAAMYGVNALFEWEAQREWDARQAERQRTLDGFGSAVITDDNEPPFALDAGHVEWFNYLRNERAS